MESRRGASRTGQIMKDEESIIQELKHSPPPGVRFHSGHTWVRLISVDMAFVGATDFALAFAGELEGVAVPAEFHLMRAGEAAWSLLAKNGRKLLQVAPIGGRVLVANSGLLEDLERLHRNPYRDNWLLCIQSPTISRQFNELLIQEADRVWLTHTRKTMASVLGSTTKVPFEEERWHLAFGDGFSQEEWETLRQRLFPTSQHHLLQADDRN